MTRKRAELDADGLYTAPGRAYLVCPRLLELDKRHGQAPETWHWTWRHPGHKAELKDPEGHTANTLLWVAGCRPPRPEELPRCQCGRALVQSDGDPY